MTLAYRQADRIADALEQFIAARTRYERLRGGNRASAIDVGKTRQRLIEVLADALEE